ncbi:HPr kinase/phosphorylase [Carnobacteriaceae bacterium zg-ZUI252]|nr:HPr kinase/phosphorylase [Carnobacteriaceae bacterium zg-ZUI252]MBS4769815.1 HPr kinase/phosphorylase [Carnobacteriaceae bacterium zg-ZUI240]QTU82669.1 HPr kinase/phosphorylase [Carnobacteriaceae bacterium zg-C25]
MTVTIQQLIDTLHIKVQHGCDNLNRTVSTSELSRPGLELSGYFDYYSTERIQVFGRTEIAFLQQLPDEKAKDVIKQLCHPEIPAFIMARNLPAPQLLVDRAKEVGIPILQSASKTTSVISNLTNYLETQLAVRESIHGVFIDVYGVGVLITGDSGVGKSETALDLIKNGHRLVADDRIDFYQIDELTLVGEAPAILKNLLEVRGIGIVDVMTIFGASAVKETKKLEMIVHLEMWDGQKIFDRLGNNQETVRIIDVDVPKFTIPVKLGRNLANIVEVATMNYRAKNMGFDATQAFQEKLNQLIEINSGKE